MAAADHIIEAWERADRVLARRTYLKAIAACDEIAGNTKDFNSERRKGAGQCSAAIRALMQSEGHK